MAPPAGNHDWSIPHVVGVLVAVAVYIVIFAYSGDSDFLIAFGERRDRHGGRLGLFLFRLGRAKEIACTCPGNPPGGGGCSIEVSPTQTLRIGVDRRGMPSTPRMCIVKKAS